MTTLVNQSVTAICAALQSAPAVAASIGRVNLRPIAQASAQAVVVRPLGAVPGSVTEYAGQPLLWECSIAVECYARSTGSAAPDQSVDALLESVYARLMQDTTLSGAVLSIDPKQITYDFDADGDKSACATLVFSTISRASAGLLS